MEESQMKKNKEIKNKEKKQIDAGKIFVKVMAGILACLMLFSVTGTLIFALI